MCIEKCLDRRFMEYFHDSLALLNEHSSLLVSHDSCMNQPVVSCHKSKTVSAFVARRQYKDVLIGWNNQWLFHYINPLHKPLI